MEVKEISRIKKKEEKKSLQSTDGGLKKKGLMRSRHWRRTDGENVF